MKSLLFAVLCLLSCKYINAQVKIGDNPTIINTNSILELETTNKGLVLPRIPLINVDSSAPLSATVLNGTIIYNTNQSISGGSGAGIYLWVSPRWRFIDSSLISSVWQLQGNSITSGQFLGTLNSQPLNFKYNNTAAGTLDGGGNAAFGVGYTITGIKNTAIGGSAAASNSATAIGNGSVASAANATALGINAKAQASNATAIGYNATTSQSNALVLGDAANVNVGIGTSTPNTGSKLDVAGSFKLGSTGSVLTSIIKASVTVSSFLLLLNITNIAIVTVSGATTNNYVVISPRSALPNAISIAYAYVSSADTIVIGFINSGAVGISLGNITFDIIVIK